MARIGLATLQYNKEEGGLAVPHSRAYYLASQLQQLGGWGLIDMSDPICRLLALTDESTTALTCLEAGYMHFDPGAPTILLLKTLWSYIKQMLGIQGFLTHTPPSGET